MTVFIEAETDPFVDERMELAESYQAQFRNEANVRRPTRGHLLKEDTYAILRVMGSDGNFIPVLDAAGEEIYSQDNRAYTTYYSNFFVQSTQDQRSEKQQIVDTFGESYIFFFGESPKLYQVQGLLLNTADFNWRDEFWENYERYFRGTKLVERGARLYLIYDDIIVEGYMIMANATEQSQNPWVIPFSFQMFVTGYTALSKIGDPTFPGSEGGTYRGSAGLGYYDEGIQKWVGEEEASRNATAHKLKNLSSNGQENGQGKLLTDSLRDGTASAGDPSSSSYTQDLANIMGQGSRLEFRPNPRLGDGRFINNSDEFVQRAILPTVKENNFDDNWENGSKSVDEGILNSTNPDSTGASPDLSDSDYVDTMGRNGFADQEINDSGGGRLQGEGVRRDLGGSDLPDNTENRNSGWSPNRNTPFGSTSQPGELG